MQVSRNRPCPCGSGKKYKRCCARKGVPSPGLLAAIQVALQQRAAAEAIRTQQQGLGRPIISTDYRGQKVIAVGNRVYFDPSWRTFPDFLAHYIFGIFGADFFSREASVSSELTHPVTSWNKRYHAFLKANATPTQKINHAAATGIVYCYIGLAYNLYLLAHNVELQQRFIRRLRQVDQFQGAYYELIVANSLIRAGFELTLEDEVDEASKHCEFSALSRHTNTRYWVEAKSRGVDGVLGRTRATGVPASRQDPTTSLTKHLKQALEKPAEGPRLIFIDLNCPWTSGDRIPTWVQQAERRLQDRERNLVATDSAYVFVTNAPFYLDLDSQHAGMEVLAYGLGISDFGKPGYFTLGQQFRSKQKHRDAHNVLRSLGTYPTIPVTLDGRLPSESFGTAGDRCLIGTTYFFEALNAPATVLDAAVLEGESKVFYTVRTSDGRSWVLSRDLSPDELADFKAHPEGYFGAVRRSPAPVTDPYEFFEFVLEQHRGTPRSKLLEMWQGERGLDRLSSLSDEDLLIEVCEQLVASMLPRAA